MGRSLPTKTDTEPASAPKKRKKSEAEEKKTTKKLTDVLSMFRKGQKLY